MCSTIRKSFRASSVEMIASFSKNFVFIRTRKTASTSTEIVLGSWCSPGDIVTPIGVEDEILRLEFGGSPANFCEDRALEERYKSSLRTKDVATIASIYRDVMKRLKFHHHMSAAEAKSMLPAQFWSKAHKFAVDRHPYEKAVSLAFWRNRRVISDGASVQDYLDETIDQGEYRNFELYTIGGKLAVDKVYRFDRLWQELSALSEINGAAMPAALPRAKSQYRVDRRPSHELLT